MLQRWTLEEKPKTSSGKNVVQTKTNLEYNNVSLVI